jgi:hypothetical protein
VQAEFNCHYRRAIIPPRINGSRVRREPLVRRIGAFQTNKCASAP